MMDLTEALEKLAKVSRKLADLEDAISEHLPHYEPELERGEYIEIVKIAGKELNEMLDKLDKPETEKPETHVELSSPSWKEDWLF